MTRYARSLPAYLLLLYFVSVSVMSVEAQAPTNAPVKLFQGPNATGAQQEIPPGTYRVNGKELGSAARDPVFSVQVAKGFRVRFCDDQGPSGNIGEKCEEYAEGRHNLRSINFTLIRVWRDAPSNAGIPPIVVYEARNWTGRTQIFLPGMYRSDRNEFGRINDNMAMSAVIAKGFRVRFCVDEGVNARGSGDCEEHDEGRHNLRFANAISFIEVTDLNDKSPADDTMPVILYEDGSQGGKRQGFDVGTFLASLNQLGRVGNDTASSIVVKNGYRVLLCRDEVPGEKCEELGAGKHNLRQKDSASYVKVWKSDK